MLHYRCVYYSHTVGQRSDHPLSPAYVPSSFSFTPSPKKRRAEQGLERYEAAKRRREDKDRTDAANALLELASPTDYSPVYPPNTVCVATQI